MTDTPQWEPPPAIVKTSTIAFCVADGWEDPELSIVELGLERPIWKRHEHAVSAAILASPLPECVAVLKRILAIWDGAIAVQADYDTVSALLAKLDPQEPADETR